MTLVIGKLDPEYNDFRILSDTRIVNEVKKEHSKLFEGIVKTIIYTPQICISYAGSNVSAEEIHRSIFGTNFKLDIKTLVRILVNFHRHRNNDIEFLITNIQHNMLGFIKISQGKIETSNKSSWIGDHDAFELFQEKYHAYKSKKNSMYVSSEKAFADIILSPRCKTVGGVLVEVERTPTGFSYIKRVLSSLGRSKVIDSKSNIPQIIDFGSAEEGSYNFCRLVSNNQRLPAFGNYYYDGKFGIFAYPEKSRYFKLYKGLDVNEFVKKIKDEHEIKLMGLVSERGTIRSIS